MMREGLNASRALGMELRRPAFLALVADVCERMKRPEEGLSAVDEALTAGQGTGQHYWDAELHRLRGVLTLQSEAIPRRTSRTSQAHPGTFTRAAPRSAAQRTPAERNAEACFLQALEIARRQRARLFELRAATSLSRLLAARGRAKEAHALLSTVYREFTEGFDTPDLTEAKAVLDALGA